MKEGSIGETNEAKIEADNVECLALIDSGAKLSTITVTFCQMLRVPIHKLDQLL